MNIPRPKIPRKKSRSIKTKVNEETEPDGQELREKVCECIDNLLQAQRVERRNLKGGREGRAPGGRGSIEQSNFS